MSCNYLCLTQIEIFPTTIHSFQNTTTARCSTMKLHDYFIHGPLPRNSNNINIVVIYNIMLDTSTIILYHILMYLRLHTCMGHPAFITFDLFYIII